MMKSPLLARVSCGLSIAILALAFISSVSTVRAQTDVPSWMLADPISDAVKALEERLTSLEAKVASVSESITSRASAEHQLCVADDTGARTCINKAQLDRLLRMMQAAAIEPPAQVTNSTDSVTTSVATTTPAPVEPVEAVASAPETKASEEPSRIETTEATIVEAPRQDAQDAQAALAQETLDQESMPTGSVPASAASDGRALVIHPEVEITTPPTEH